MTTREQYDRAHGAHVDALLRARATAAALVAAADAMSGVDDGERHLARVALDVVKRELAAHGVST